MLNFHYPLLNLINVKIFFEIYTNIFFLCVFLPCITLTQVKKINKLLRKSFLKEFHNFS